MTPQIGSFTAEIDAALDRLDAFAYFGIGALWRGRGRGTRATA